MKMTDEQTAANNRAVLLAINSMKEEITSLKEEFKVLANTTKVMKSAIAASNIIIENQKKSINELQKDLELERPRYNSDPTRKIARDAFNQSTAEANWKSLEEHPVIKNVYKAIMDSRKDLGKSIQRNAIRLDNVQPANEVFKELKNSETITQMNNVTTHLHEQLDRLNNTITTDRTHANKQDLRLRDKMADLITVQDRLDFIQSETIFKYDAAFIFLMGAWAKSGFEPVAEGLRIMLKKPKEEKKQDAPPS